MIRINLLSDREAIRKESSRQQISVLVLSLCLLLVVLGGVHFRLVQKKNGLEEEIRQVNKVLAELQAKVGKVEEYKAAKQELEAKLLIIATLETGKLRVPRMLDNLAGSMPEKMWVEKMVLKGNSLSMEGFAIDHETIATFMKALEQSPFFSNVELLLTEKKEVGGVAMKSFSIMTQTDSMPRAKTEAGPGGKASSVTRSPSSPEEQKEPR
jgi:type IV pilus assembly protein PilN